MRLASPHARTGITLPETIGLACVLLLVLLIAAMGMSAKRNEMKRKEVWELLRQLDAALQAYHDATGQWPAPPLTHETQHAPQPPMDPDDAQPVVQMLAAVPASARILESVPPHSRIPTTNKSEFVTIQDAWGTRLHCFTARSPGLIDRQAVAANGGKPIFISASQDKQFVGPDGSAAADNLRSDELPR